MKPHCEDGPAELQASCLPVHHTERYKIYLQPSALWRLSVESAQIEVLVKQTFLGGGADVCGVRCQWAEPKDTGQSNENMLILNCPIKEE